MVGQNTDRPLNFSFKKADDWMFGKFESNTIENAVLESSQNKEQNSKIDVLFDDEIDYLEKNTTDSNKSPSNVSVIDYTDDELKELYEDFAGYTNGDVRYENNGKNMRM